MIQRSPDDEKRFVARLKKRDERAFNELIRDYQTQVYNLVYRMLAHNREDALDVSQEVFVTVFRSIDGFRGESRLSTWIWRIAVNHCRNRLQYQARRKSGRHDELDESLLADDASGGVADNQPSRPDKELESRETEKFLQEAIAALDDEQREILVLRDIQSLAYDEIVAITGLPDGTVKSRLHRARLALQRCFEEWQRSGARPRKKPGGLT